MGFRYSEVKQNDFFRVCMARDVVQAGSDCVARQDIPSIRSAFFSRYIPA